MTYTETKPMTLRDKVVAKLNQLNITDVRGFIKEKFGNLSTNIAKDLATDWLLEQEQAEKDIQTKAELQQVTTGITNQAAEFKPETIKEYETAIEKRIVLKMVYRGFTVNMVDLSILNKGTEYYVTNPAGFSYMSESINIKTAWRTAVRMIDTKLDAESGEIIEDIRTDLHYYPDSLVAALYERHDVLNYLRYEMYRRGLMLSMKQSKLACSHSN
jgi:hypothetical protein